MRPETRFEWCLRTATFTFGVLTVLASGIQVSQAEPLFGPALGLVASLWLIVSLCACYGVVMTLLFFQKSRRLSQAHEFARAGYRRELLERAQFLHALFEKERTIQIGDKTSRSSGPGGLERDCEKEWARRASMKKDVGAAKKLFWQARGFLLEQDMLTQQEKEWGSYWQYLKLEP